MATIHLILAFDIYKRIGGAFYVGHEHISVLCTILELRLDSKRFSKIYSLPMASTFEQDDKFALSLLVQDYFIE